MQNYEKAVRLHETFAAEGQWLSGHAINPLVQRQL